MSDFNDFETDYRKPIIGTFVFVFVVICANWITTQYLASVLKYHTILGTPLIGSFYKPWNWIVWAHNFYAYNPVLFAKMYLISGLGMGIPLIIYAVMMSRFFSKIRNRDLHGSARWATLEDVERAGLCGGTGVYTGGAFEIGRNNTIYLRDSGPSNILSVAPTRAGKGVGQVLPTLLSWPDSVVVNDIKGENYALTAGYQKALGKLIFRFDPGNPSGASVKFNPLNEIRIGTQREIGDVQTICTMIVDDDGEAFTGSNAHWNSAALNLMIGLVLHILYVEKREGKTASPATILEIINNPDKPIMDVLNEIMAYQHLDGSENHLNEDKEIELNKKPHPHPVIAQSMREVLNKADKERDSVISTAVTKLGLYKDPVVVANTAYSEFKISDLMNHDQPVALYLCTKPAELDKFRPLLRLIIELLVARLTEEMEFEDGRAKATHKHKLLMMLDEFAAMGRMKIVEKAMAFTAGWGIKFYLILQTYAQLMQTYGENQAITSNCHVTILYPTNDLKGAEMISKTCGITTVIDKTVSYSGKKLGSLDSKSVTTQKVQRPLMTADEVMQMPGPVKDGQGNIKKGGEILVVTAGNPVAKCRQLMYFMESLFLERAKIPPPEKSDAIYTKPERKSILKPMKTSLEP